MDKKIIMIIILAIIVVGLSIACATVILPKNNNATTNITNNTTNKTNSTINVTHIGNTTESTDSSAGNSNPKADSKAESDPAYGSDEYVAKWDQSQRNGDSWAYTHNQPTKSENGQSYHRMYNPDTGESYWQPGI